MRPLPGLLIATVLLVGCGSDERVTGTGDPAPTPAAPELLTLVSQSDVGGEVDPRAVPLEGDAALEEFTDRFADDRMRVALAAALEEVDVPDGQVPAAAVVAVGCETPAPADVAVEASGGGVQVTATPSKGGVQCLVPVTTVAVVAASPADL